MININIIATLHSSSHPLFALERALEYNYTACSEWGGTVVQWLALSPLSKTPGSGASLRGAVTVRVRSGSPASSHSPQTSARVNLQI